MTLPYDAVILAGGAARRLGGADKPSVRIGGRTLLDRVLAACSGAARTIVVGPRRPTYRPVDWVREHPPGGGPLAALDTGLRRVGQPLAVVLAADLPFLTSATIDELLAVPSNADGVLLTDHVGRDQPLTAVYRTEPLRGELTSLAAEHGHLGGLPFRLALGALRLHRVTGHSGSLDCDTWSDISDARSRIREHGTVLDEWIAAVKTELDVDPEVDITTLLDTARDAAHGVARPAAPLTTFLIGYAAARDGLDPAEAARRVSALAIRWQREEEQEEKEKKAEQGK